MGKLVKCFVAVSTCPKPGSQEGVLDTCPRPPTTDYVPFRAHVASIILNFSYYRVKKRLLDRSPWQINERM